MTQMHLPEGSASPVDGLPSYEEYLTSDPLSVWRSAFDAENLSLNPPNYDDAIRHCAITLTANQEDLIHVGTFL